MAAEKICSAGLKTVRGASYEKLVLDNNNAR